MQETQVWIFGTINVNLCRSLWFPLKESHPKIAKHSGWGTHERDRAREKMKWGEGNFLSRTTPESLNYSGAFLILIFFLIKALKRHSFHPKWKGNLTESQYSCIREKDCGNLLPVCLIEVLEVSTNTASRRGTAIGGNGTTTVNCQEKHILLGSLRHWNLFAIKLYRLDRGVGGKAEESRTALIEGWQNASHLVSLIAFVLFKSPHH